MNKKIIKVCIFNSHSTPSEVMQGNGEAILDNICISCETIENLDGTYELDATFIVDDEGLHKLVSDEAILKVALDYGDEVFRIAKVKKGIRDVIVFARQITISETLDMWIEDTRPTNTSGLSALNSLKNNSIGKKDIQVFSNITNTSTAYYQRMNVYEAIHDCDQSFLTRWGGEVQRRCYNLTINNSIGSDKGVQIRSKKNLIGFEANTNIDNVVTRVRPVGFDGIDAGKFVDSPFINKYSAIKTKEIKYEDVKVKDENNPDEGYDTLEEAQAELIRRAELEFSQNHIDELRAEYLINFISLEQTEEYKNFIQAERVYIGDTIQVYEEKHNININVRVISKRYDILKQKVIEVELSNNDITQKSITTSDILAELGSIIDKTQNNNISDIIQSMINSGIKDSYVITRQNELIVADNKDLDKANNVIRINKNGLAFSKNGYYGDYEYGFTIDGVINASLISTGILSTILIQNADGSLQIDLSGTKGIMTKRNGKNAIELAGTTIKFHEWDGEGENIGQIHSTRLNGAEGRPGLVVANKSNAFLSLGYEKDDNFHSYMNFDRDKVNPNTKVPITIFNEAEFRGSQLWFGHDTNSIYNSTANHFVNNVKNSFIIADKNTSSSRLVLNQKQLNLYDVTNDLDRYACISPSETFFGSNGSKYFNCSHGAFSFWDNKDGMLYTTTSNSICSNRDFHVNKNFTVSGTKNCIQPTKHYGDRLYYSVEDCESYLTDRSMELFTVEETNEGTFERIILLDNIYKESVNLDIGYTVEVIKQGFGDYRIKEQTKDYFIVEADRKDFTFKYVVTAKRLGFEEDRNKEFYISSKEESINFDMDYLNLNNDNEVNKEAE